MFLNPDRSATRASQPGGRAAPLGLRVRPFRIGQYAFLLLVVLIADLPLVWVVLNAFKPAQEIVAFPPTILPSTLSLEHFTTLFTLSEFGTYLRNSLFVATTATALTLLLGTTAAYSLTRFRFRVVRATGELALFAYLVPPIVVLVPIAQILLGMGLRSNLLALTILYTALLLPFALWILRSYFLGIAQELEQAAMVDGCTRFGAFIRVVLPQAIPGLVSTGVFTFNAAWSEYLYASTLMTRPDSLTLSPGLTLLLFEVGYYSWGVLMAGSVVLVVPTLIVFLIVQRQLVHGAAQGAIK